MFNFCFTIFYKKIFQIHSPVVASYFLVDLLSRIGRAEIGEGVFSTIVDQGGEVTFAETGAGTACV